MEKTMSEEAKQMYEMMSRMKMTDGRQHLSKIFEQRKKQLEEKLLKSNFSGNYTKKDYTMYDLDKLLYRFLCEIIEMPEEVLKGYDTEISDINEDL